MHDLWIFFCRFGKDSVDCVVSKFRPLEWSLLNPESPYANLRCFAKIVIKIKDKNNILDSEVLGLHITAPNAGEIIQGYAALFKKGDIKYRDLTDTVGIHPTIAEEFTIMNFLKVSNTFLILAFLFLFSYYIYIVFNSLQESCLIRLDAEVKCQRCIYAALALVDKSFLVCFQDDRISSEIS